MTLPVKAGDAIQQDDLPLLLTVTRVHVIDPMTDEQRETAKWLGYTLGHYDESCLYVEYKIPGCTVRGSTKVHMEPDEQGRLVSMIDPDSWAGGRYSVARRGAREHAQGQLFEDILA